MRALYVQHRAFQKLFPVKIPELGQAVRPFDYLVTAKVPEGLLAYQTALCSLVLLEGEEQALLQGGALPQEPSETLRFLVENRFLVTAEHDDYSFCQTVRTGAKLIQRLTEKEEGYGGFTILTTTACNARCFYCFEKGVRTETMTPETAAAVADFILKEGNPEHVRLAWFGGEPTVNERVIDQITGLLADAGREYASSMISNGYLMDEKMAKKAAEQWKLKNIQITLDGTEKIYNERKSYVGVRGSAFQTVMNNIGFLLDAGIEVSIRLNVDTENTEDLCMLAGQLRERFSEKKMLSVYANMLFDDDGLPSSHDERLLAARKVRQHLEELGFGSRSTLDHFPKAYNCMADSGSGPVIMPDGSLKSCEHINMAPSWGSVFRAERRPEEENAYWNEQHPEQPECRDCASYPACIRLKHCEPTPAVCTEVMREESCRKLSDSLLKTWERIREGRQDEEKTDEPCS